MKLVFALCFTFLTVLSFSNAADIWTDCSGPSATLKLSKVVITPDPPVRNMNLTLFVEGSLSKPIKEGTTVTYKIWYEGFVLKKGTDDLCQDLIEKDTPKKCPFLPNTDYKQSYTTALPPKTPKGHYKAKVVVTDQDANEVHCIALDFKLK
ncbi:hypothetical protein PCE1_000296 [Barthelona sp. PCE]